MKIAVLAYGSRGDVQPAVALASALVASGHATSLVAPRNFAALAAGRGVDFRPLPIDTIEDLHGPESEILFSGGGNPIAFLRWSVQAGRKSLGAGARATLEGATGADLIVATGLTVALGAMLAERFKVPCVYGWCQPALAARDFLFTISETAPPRMPGWANRALFMAFEQALWLAMRPVYRSTGELYGPPPLPFVPPLRRAVARGETLLRAYSEALLPRSREWPANVEVTGWWFLDDGGRWAPPPELERFTIAIGFAS
ncbi:MAG TPA: glycosyltransferase [Roseiarcus sp.]|jgi:UDP:flavonoid glycosyltransferase YjiC (YdhE family)